MALVRLHEDQYDPVWRDGMDSEGSSGGRSRSEPVEATIQEHIEYMRLYDEIERLKKEAVTAEQQRDTARVERARLDTEAEKLLTELDELQVAVRAERTLTSQLENARRSLEAKVGLLAATVELSGVEELLRAKKSELATVTKSTKSLTGELTALQKEFERQKRRCNEELAELQRNLDPHKQEERLNGLLAILRTNEKELLQANEALRARQHQLSETTKRLQGELAALELSKARATQEMLDQRRLLEEALTSLSRDKKTVEVERATLEGERRRCPNLAKLARGQFLYHTEFGAGTVLAVLKDGKVRVQFQYTTEILPLDHRWLLVHQE